MTALLIVLVLTNVASLAALVALRLRARAAAARTDARVVETLAGVQRSATPGTSAGRTRRVISIEILNPIELAGVRGRMFGIAGSFVPHLTRRIVYDQTVRQLREQLAARHVVADVRVHVIAPSEAAGDDEMPAVDPAAPAWSDDADWERPG